MVSGLEVGIRGGGVNGRQPPPPPNFALRDPPALCLILRVAALASQSSPPFAVQFCVFPPCVRGAMAWRWHESQYLLDEAPHQVSSSDRSMPSTRIFQSLVPPQPPAKLPAVREPGNRPNGRPRSSCPTTTTTVLVPRSLFPVCAAAQIAPVRPFWASCGNSVDKTGHSQGHGAWTGEGHQDLLL